jgi:hypothetical protein
MSAGHAMPKWQFSSFFARLAWSMSCSSTDVEGLALRLRDVRPAELLQRCVRMGNGTADEAEEGLHQLEVRFFFRALPHGAAIGMTDL